MRLCLDENLRSKDLRNRLEAAGHEVVDLELGISDSQVWDFAQRLSAVLVTGNAVDFEFIARSSAGHAGVLLVYREHDPRRDMTYAHIAAAVRKVEAVYGDSLSDQIIVLNQFR